MSTNTQPEEVEDAKIVGALPDDIEARNAVARESIDKARAMWERRQRSLAPLPRMGALAALHAGLRERVATSVFSPPVDQLLLMGVERQPYFRGQPQFAGKGWPPFFIPPCVAAIPALPIEAVAALITFWNRGERARAGTLEATGRME